MHQIEHSSVRRHVTEIEKSDSSVVFVIGWLCLMWKFLIRELASAFDIRNVQVSCTNFLIVCR